MVVIDVEVVSHKGYKLLRWLMKTSRINFNGCLVEAVNNGFHQSWTVLLTQSCLVARNVVDLLEIAALVISRKLVTFSDHLAFGVCRPRCASMARHKV